MLEIVVLAILILAVAGGAVIRASEMAAAERTWPATRAELLKSEPAEEGAPVSQGEPLPEAELRKAA